MGIYFCLFEGRLTRPRHAKRPERTPRPPTGSPRTPCPRERHGTGGAPIVGAGRGLRCCTQFNRRPRPFIQPAVACVCQGRRGCNQSAFAGLVPARSQGASQCSFGWKCASGDTEANLLELFPGMPGWKGEPRIPSFRSRCVQY